MGLLAAGIFLQLHFRGQNKMFWNIGASFIFFGVLGVVFGMYASYRAKMLYNKAKERRKTLKDLANTSSDLANFVAEDTSNPCNTSPKEDRISNLQAGPSASASSIESERIKRSRQMRKVDMDTFLEFVQPESHKPPPHDFPFDLAHIPYIDDTTSNSSDVEEQCNRV